MKKKIDKNQNLFKKKMMRTMKTYRGIFGLDIDNPVIQLKVEISDLSLHLTKGELEFQLNLFNYENETFLVDPFINTLFFTKEKFRMTESIINKQIGKFMMETISLVFRDLNSSFFINNIYLIFTIYIFDSFLYPGQNKEKSMIPNVHPPYKRILSYGFLNLTEAISQGKLIKGLSGSYDVGLYFLKEAKEEKLKEGLEILFFFIKIKH